MSQTNCEIARGYYTALGEKRDVGGYLASDVEFKSPFSQLVGKESVVELVNGFMPMFKSLKIHSVFASGDEAVVIYDVDGTTRAAALMRIQKGLIARIELFFDPRPFM